jgi:hypothetical protein
MMRRSVCDAFLFSCTKLTNLKRYYIIVTLKSSFYDISIALVDLAMKFRILPIEFYRKSSSGFTQILDKIMPNCLSELLPIFRSLI